MPTQEELAALAAHNDARRCAPGAPRPPLQWSASLTSAAKTWATHLAHTGTFLHLRDRAGKTGENLYRIRRSDGKHTPLMTGVQAWVEERELYNGERIGEHRAGCGHYTQVIWPTTVKVGMASVLGKGGWQVMVARYEPSGNWVGESAYGEGYTRGRDIRLHDSHREGTRAPNPAHGSGPELSQLQIPPLATHQHLQVPQVTQPERLHIFHRAGNRASSREPSRPRHTLQMHESTRRPGNTRPVTHKIEISDGEVTASYGSGQRLGLGTRERGRERSDGSMEEDSRIRIRIDGKEVRMGDFWVGWGRR